MDMTIATEQLHDTDPAMKLLGITMQSLTPGKAVLSMKIQETMLNAHGICHGGFIFTLADSAFAYACNSYDFDAVAQNCSIDFLRPGKTGNVLTAVAKERYLAGRSGIYAITVTNENDEVVALFQGKSYRLR